jgi:hypothetical protein
MKKGISTLILGAATLVTAFICSGCTQMPTEKHSVSDMRPQIAFKVATDGAHSARILLDGLDVGALENYLEGVAAVRILPGTHTLRVVSGNAILLDERFYIGDGVNRTFIVK